MMMERVQTAPATEETAKSSTNSIETSVDQPVPVSSQERVQELERRLNDLDVVKNDGGENAAQPAPVDSVAIAGAKPFEEEQMKTAAGTTKSNPLLARIMAAQERARIAEQQEKEAKAAAAQAEEQRRKSQAEAAIAAAQLRELQAEIEKTNKFQMEYEAKTAVAQVDVAGMEIFQKQTEQDAQQQNEMRQRQSIAAQKRDKILRELQGLPAESPVPTAAIPIIKSMDTPPPPPIYPMGLVAPNPQQQQEQQPKEQMALPSFDVTQEVNATNNSVPTPSAPPVSPMHDHLEGVLPLPAPVPPPPSFAQYEQQLHQKQPHHQLETDSSFDFDVDGIPLSPEERQQMLEEQRRLYENIMKDKAANDLAIAQANADTFNARSTAAASRAEQRVEHMDCAGRDLDQTAMGTGKPKTEGEDTDDVNAPKRFVKIGNNQTVALHGQERTKKAIRDGSALLVQCINCQNWMQVTATATLMFCPVCQVVCPVIQQNEVLTKEQAIQLTMDRKLAEKLQAEAYTFDGKKVQETGYFARLFGSGETSTETSASQNTLSCSWWDKISSIVSYGVEEEPRNRGDIGVTRPPGSYEINTGSSISTYPGQRRPGSINSGTITGDEARSLLSTPNATNLHPVVIDGNEANLPAGRIAEQRPLLSCVYDSVSNVASSVFSTDAFVPDEDGNVNGVDARSLLAVTEREEDDEEDMSRSVI